MLRGGRYDVNSLRRLGFEPLMRLAEDLGGSNSEVVAIDMLLLWSNERNLNPSEIKKLLVDQSKPPWFEKFRDRWVLNQRTITPKQELLEIVKKALARQGGEIHA